MTQREVAAYVGVSRYAIRQWTAEGLIPHSWRRGPVYSTARIVPWFREERSTIRSGKKPSPDNSVLREIAAGLAALRAEQAAADRSASINATVRESTATPSKPPPVRQRGSAESVPDFAGEQHDPRRRVLSDRMRDWIELTPAEVLNSYPALTMAQAAYVLGFMDGKGKPVSDQVRRLVRDARLLLIDETQPVTQWRVSATTIRLYIAGDRRAATGVIITDDYLEAWVRTSGVNIDATLIEDLLTARRLKEAVNADLEARRRRFEAGPRGPR